MVIRPWQVSTKKANLNHEKVQIWSAFFGDENINSFSGLLSKDEIERANHLIDSGIASRQIISRGILRILLGNYLGKEPKALVFGTSEFGKPFLSDPENSGISFNLSHSGNLLLIAVTAGKQIGIDVEKNEVNMDFPGIASLVFSGQEQICLSHSTDPIHEFYKIWTAKEAILKSTGLGFSYPSNRFSVITSKENNSQPRILKDLPVGFDLSYQSFLPSEGYSAAIAMVH
jgi:4'-phosphopantetheinyl transferase